MNSYFLVNYIVSLIMLFYSLYIFGEVVSFLTKKITSYTFSNLIIVYKKIRYNFKIKTQKG